VFAGVVYTYHATIDPNANVVVLKDNGTRKKIGTFTERGLDLN